MSTNTRKTRAALYYPFHLCHARTLETLLTRYDEIHFRDYMAIQLTALSGTTAYQDRMGDTFPDLVHRGRIVQGYSVSGPLSSDLVAAVDRDLADHAWRQTFHQALDENRRFQRGLFDFTHAMAVGCTLVPGPAALLQLLTPSWRDRAFSLADIQQWSRSLPSLADGYAYEYGLALVKTSASLAYTIRLATAHALDVVTDSPAHFELLQRTCVRDSVVIQNDLIDRHGY